MLALGRVMTRSITHTWLWAFPVIALMMVWLTLTGLSERVRDGFRRLYINADWRGDILAVACGIGVIVLLGVTTGCASANHKSAAVTFLKAEAGYTAVLQLAANYVAMPRCQDETPNVKVCSEQRIVDAIRPAVNSADATVQAAEDLATAPNPPDNALQLAVQAANAATASLQAILANYGIEGN